MACAIGNGYGTLARISAAAVVLIALAALPGVGGTGGMLRPAGATAAAVPAPAPKRAAMRMSSQAKRDLDMAAYLSADGMALQVAGSGAARAADPIEGLAGLGGTLRDPQPHGPVAPASRD